MRVLIAIGVSVLVHLVLAAGLWWYFTVTPSPVVLAQLDLSSVELSLADEDVAAAVPVASLAAIAEPPAARPEPVLPKPPTPNADAVEPTMPTVAEPKPPEPSAPELPPVPVVAPKQARVDAPPKPKRTIRPDYPRGSRLRKEEGDVVLEIHVTAEGGVSNVQVVGSSGFAELDAAAVGAAKAARFTPAKSGREDVASVARLKLSFRLK